VQVTVSCWLTASAAETPQTVVAALMAVADCETTTCAEAMAGQRSAAARARAITEIFLMTRSFLSDSRPFDAARAWQAVASSGFDETNALPLMRIAVTFGPVRNVHGQFVLHGGNHDRPDAA
jgi:hypothetical protein